MFNTEVAVHSGELRRGKLRYYLPSSKEASTRRRKRLGDDYKGKNIDIQTNKEYRHEDEQKRKGASKEEEATNQ